MKNFLQKEGTRSVLASLISILIGLVAGSVLILIVGLTTKGLGLQSAWEGIRLVFFGLFVGAAMLVIGLAWRMLARRNPQAATAAGDGHIVDAEFRVVERPELPAPR